MQEPGRDQYMAYAEVSRNLTRARRADLYLCDPGKGALQPSPVSVHLLCGGLRHGKASLIRPSKEEELLGREAGRVREVANVIELSHGACSHGAALRQQFVIHLHDFIEALILGDIPLGHILPQPGTLARDAVPWPECHPSHA